MSFGSLMNLNHYRKHTDNLKMKKKKILGCYFYYLYPVVQLLDTSLMIPQ